MKYYSKTTGGFYDPSINGSNVPDDIVVITEQEYTLLFEEQASGKIITPDANGYPVAIEFIPPIVVKTLEEIAAEKHAAVQVEKCRVRDSGVLVDGVLFDTDLTARISYMELFTQFSVDPTFTTDWKASTGVWAMMDAVLLQAVMAAGKAHIQAAFAWQAGKDLEIDAALAAEDQEALEAISTEYGN